MSFSDAFSSEFGIGAHCAWWDTQYPGDYEHWQFADGFIQGWDDAYIFFSLSQGGATSVSEVGFKGAWAKRRAAEHARQKGDKGLWEYGTLLSLSSFVDSLVHTVVFDNRTWSCARNHCGEGGRTSIFRLTNNVITSWIRFNCSSS